MPKATFIVIGLLDGTSPMVAETADPEASIRSVLDDAYHWNRNSRAILRHQQAFDKSVDAPVAAMEENRVDAETGAPICGIHQVPMVQVKGRHGFFWSCHEKDPNGSWCNYRPPQSET